MVFILILALFQFLLCSSIDPPIAQNTQGPHQQETNQQNEFPLSILAPGHTSPSLFLQKDGNYSVEWLFSSPFQLFLPLNSKMTDFIKKCDQRLLPNPNCFSLPSSHNPNYEDFNSIYNLSYADFIYPSHKHMTYIMYYNLVERLPVHEMGNRLSRIFKESNKVLKSYDKNSPKDKLNEKVPRIMHKIWVTHSLQPFEVPEKLWDSLREFFVELPPDAVVYFWVMDVEPIRRSLTAIKRIGMERMIIKRAEELLEMMTPLMKDFFFKIYDERQLAKASDILRFFALFKYGGVFTDLDMTIRKGFLFALDYDLTLLVFSLSKSHVAEIYFIACTPQHPSIKRYLEYWEHHEALFKGPLRIVSDLDLHWQMSFCYFWGVAVYEEIFKNESHKALLFSIEKAREFIYHKFDQSWQEGKYGNHNDQPYPFSPKTFDLYLRVFSRPMNVQINRF